MAFAGIKKPEKRADLIAYLNSLGSNKPIPEFTPPATEEAAEPAAEEGTAKDAEAAPATPPAELPESN